MRYGTLSPRWLGITRGWNRGRTHVAEGTGHARTTMKRPLRELAPLEKVDARQTSSGSCRSRSHAAFRIGEYARHREQHQRSSPSRCAHVALLIARCQSSQAARRTAAPPSPEPAATVVKRACSRKIEAARSRSRGSWCARTPGCLVATLPRTRSGSAPAATGMQVGTASQKESEAKSCADACRGQRKP